MLYEYIAPNNLLENKTIFFTAVSFIYMMRIIILAIIRYDCYIYSHIFMASLKYQKHFKKWFRVE